VARPIQVLQMQHLQGIHTYGEGSVAHRTARSTSATGREHWQRGCCLRVVPFQEGVWSMFFGRKPPTPSFISNTGLIDGVSLPTLMGFYNICGPLGLLHHNGSNPSDPTSGSNPVGSTAYFQQHDECAYSYRLRFSPICKDQTLYRTGKALTKHRGRHEEAPGFVAACFAASPTLGNIAVSAVLWAIQKSQKKMVFHVMRLPSPSNRFFGWRARQPLGLPLSMEACYGTSHVLVPHCS
jgi:hypothetical protein